MKEGNTTLSVPKDFASRLRKDYDGHNDLERLENWKSEDTKDSYNEDITNKELLKKIKEIEPLTKMEVDDILQRYL